MTDAPALSVIVELEAAPTAHIVSWRDDQTCRLCDWLIENRTQIIAAVDAAIDAAAAECANFVRLDDLRRAA